SLFFTGCGEERDLLSETTPDIQCSFLNRPDHMQCGLTHAFDLRVSGAKAHYSMEQVETRYDQNDEGAAMQWAEDAVFSLTAEGFYQDTGSRWIAIRRYEWSQTGGCAAGNQERTALELRPHKVTEVFRVQDAEGREKNCELNYDIL